MADQFVLTEESAKILQRLLDDYSRMRKNRPGLTFDSEAITTPDVYVARTPGTGIPALRMDLDTGTGTLPVGTASAFQGNTPGSAECNIYRALYTSTTPNLMPIGITRTVLNLSTTAVGGNDWVLVIRDKFGQWYVTDVAGGGGSSSLRVREYDENPSISSVIGIDTDQTTGLRVVDVTGVGGRPANTVKMYNDTADYSQSGVVTKTTQHWIGSKAFVNDNVTTYEAWGQVLFAKVVTGTQLGGVANGGSYDGSYADGGSTNRRAYSMGWSPYDTTGPWGSLVAGAGVIFGRHASTDDLVFMQFGLQSGNPLTTQIGMYSGTAPGPVPGAHTGTFFYVIGDGTHVGTGGSILKGITGTLPDGSKIQGGIIFSIGTTGSGTFRADGSWIPPSLSDAAAHTDSVYYSSTSNKIVYKDTSGVVHQFY
jgi:hypothetical protein